MSESTQDYLTRRLTEQKKVEIKLSVKEPRCINLPPEIWDAMEKLKIKEERSMNKLVELACRELLLKHKMLW
jgi:hypothetical protein